MTEETKQLTEPTDYHRYPWIHFYSDTLRFYVDAFKFYLALLKSDLKAIKEDPDLSAILGEKLLESFPIHEEIQLTERAIDWFESELSTAGERAWSHDLPMTHGTVRRIKSVCQLYLKHLRSRRDVLSIRPNISAETMKMVDQRIASLTEKFEGGVFTIASTIPLLVDELKYPPAISGPKPDTETRIAEIPTPRPILLGSIEILDTEVRKRCLDLFRQFREDGEHDRLDTVVTEATRILEDRIRRLSGAPAEVTGVDLATYVFSGKEPKLRVSPHPAEQDAAHLLFRGVFGFIRNSVHHRLVSTLTPDRVLQIVGTIDYLISVGENAKLTKQDPDFGG